MNDKTQAERVAEIQARHEAMKTLILETTHVTSIELINLHEDRGELLKMVEGLQKATDGQNILCSECGHCWYENGEIGDCSNCRAEAAEATIKAVVDELNKQAAKTRARGAEEALVWEIVSNALSILKGASDD